MWRWTLVVFALAARPGSADACSCSGRAVVLVDEAKIVPRNAQIRVAWPVGFGELDDTTLVIIPKGGVPGPVALARRTLTADSFHVVTLIPRLPLAPDQTYEVFGAARRSDPPKLVGTIRTSAVIDDTPPRWDGVGAATYVEPADPGNGSCRAGTPWIVIPLAHALRDDTTSAAAMVFGVWRQGAPFDPKAAPIALARLWHGRIELDHASVCAPRDFEIPPGVTSLKLRLAPIDLAGNIGTPADVTVDLTRPARTPPPP